MNRFLKAAGPGILFASTAIGVSHLVQSTRAGAEYGFGLAVFIVLANLAKYPFFEFGSRYANVTGTSLIDGYRSIGRWMFGLYIAVTLLTMFFVCAAVSVVTASFLSNLFGLQPFLGPHTTEILTGLLLLLCTVLLMVGQYRGLERLIKVMGTLLVIGTIVAFVKVIISEPLHGSPAWHVPDFSNDGHAFFFVIALMGWMPTAVDLSVWNSLWTIERARESGYCPTLKETLIDFNIGYLVSALLALMFMVLGANLMYNSGESMPESAPAFADRLLGLYASVIGSQSYLFIAIAAFCIMFGTCIAVLDGYARSAMRCSQLLRKVSPLSADRATYLIAVTVTAVGACLLVFWLGTGIKTLVEVAMTLSFLVAPIVGAANFYLVSGPRSHPAGRPKTWLNILAWFGLLFLSAFSVVYLVM